MITLCYLFYPIKITSNLPVLTEDNTISDVTFHHKKGNKGIIPIYEEITKIDEYNPGECKCFRLLSWIALPWMTKMSATTFNSLTDYLKIVNRNR